MACQCLCARNKLLGREKNLHQYIGTWRECICSFQNPELQAHFVGRVSPWASKARHIGLTPWDGCTTLCLGCGTCPASTPKCTNIIKYGRIIIQLPSITIKYRHMIMIFLSDLGTCHFWKTSISPHGNSDAFHFQAPCRDDAETTQRVGVCRHILAVKLLRSDRS